jgi:hypothetical protein
METRNFYIAIASIAVGMVVFWLFLYALIELDVNLFQDPNTITIQGDGLNRQITLTTTQLKSDKYDQYIDKIFHIKNSVEREYDEIYSGVSLWSVLVEETLIDVDPSLLTFQFWARDQYHSPFPLNLSIVQNNPDLVIIAYEKNGAPLFGDGPLRSVIDQTLMPQGQYSSQYSVQMLSKIIIDMHV